MKERKMSLAEKRLIKLIIKAHKQEIDNEDFEGAFEDAYENGGAKLLTSFVLLLLKTDVFKLDEDAQKDNA